MSDPEFDMALVTAAFRIAGDKGWSAVTAAEAAREAGLPVSEARVRFPDRASILLRFGVLADQAALVGASTEGPVRDRLFDILMRRFDVLQANRAGVKALLRTLPMNPPLALLLACQSKRSMRWMLQGAGVAASGPRGKLQVRGLLAVWLWAVRAWEKDESEDLSGTMAAVDAALQRAEQVANWLHGGKVAAAAESAPPTSDPSDNLPAILTEPPVDPPADDPPPQIPPQDI